ncbi:hypothetical protein [Pseudomonas sp. SLFW]|uniref:hypothetical protein n=1 Tax=Pseudomonas sp. SLFW TaxID=2683259 RepID=UPI0014133293|nr:hypothetical protein [Pseudomonas sp. SLFW]NBB09872.1 hypothetical protein [Pseudomonas sp. SLFW]
MKISYPLPPLSPTTLQTPVVTPGPPGTDATTSAQVNSNSASPAFTVKISSDAKREAGDDKYADIDKASLPEDVKEALKNIRKLQERMAEKQREIQQIMQDDSLSEETKKSRRQAAIAELQIMESAMSDAQNALNTRMSSHNLDAKDRALAKGLVGMK